MQSTWMIGATNGWVPKNLERNMHNLIEYPKRFKLIKYLIWRLSWEIENFTEEIEGVMYCIRGLNSLNFHFRRNARSEFWSLKLAKIRRKSNQIPLIIRHINTLRDSGASWIISIVSKRLTGSCYSSFEFSEIVLILHALRILNQQAYGIYRCVSSKLNQ